MSVTRPALERRRRDDRGHLIWNDVAPAAVMGDGSRSAGPGQVRARATVFGEGRAGRRQERGVGLAWPRNPSRSARNLVAEPRLSFLEVAWPGRRTSRIRVNGPQHA